MVLLHNIMKEWRCHPAAGICQWPAEWFVVVSISECTKSYLCSADHYYLEVAKIINKGHRESNLKKDSTEKCICFPGLTCALETDCDGKSFQMEIVAWSN